VIYIGVNEHTSTLTLMRVIWRTCVHTRKA
jgi:hypothetical protein